MKHTNTLTSLIKILLFFILLFLAIRLIGGAIDNSIDRQNTMLCESARVSGNRKYLKACQQYYQTGDIVYMRTMEL